MQLVNITDLEDNPHEIPQVALGIDFGTTNSLVAIVREGQVHVIPDAGGKEMIPSIVSYDGNKIKVGNDVTESEAIRSVKRLIGKDFEQVKHFSHFNFIDNHLRLDLNGKVLEPVEIAAHILNHLRKIAEGYLGEAVNHAVITVPAYFDDVERSAIKDAAKIVGLEVLRLINEPTAAALAYGLQTSKYDDEVCLVYDLGGGTFDVSILRMNRGVFQVLSTDGDILLGGDDLDQEVANFLHNKIGSSEITIQDLLSIAKVAKEKLSSCQQFMETIKLGDQEYDITLSSEEFNEIIAPYIKRTMNIVRSAISKADIEFTNIKSVVLVGGSTRIKAIKSDLQEMFGHDRVFSDIDPDQAVVYGAALQAHSLTAADSNNVLVDVLPLSLGTEVMGGLMDVIVERNTPLPVSRSKDFTTFCDGQTVMRINVCQGEREMVKHNKSLTYFELSGITPLPAGKAKIQVHFIVDVDALLTVEAFEIGNDAAKQKIQVNSNYGLNNSKIDEIITNSFQHIESDFMQRKMVESKIEANNLIRAVEKYIVTKDNHLTEEQGQELRNLIKELRVSLNGNSAEDIQTTIEALKSYFQPLVTHSINENLTKTFIGNSINNYKSDDG